MPIPLVIINSFNVLFSVLVFLLLSFFRFFLLPHFIALPLTSATNISGEVPFLSLVPVRRPPRLSRSTYFGDVAETNGGEVAWETTNNWPTWWKVMAKVKHLPSY